MMVIMRIKVVMVTVTVMLMLMLMLTIRLILAHSNPLKSEPIFAPNSIRWKPQANAHDDDHEPKTDYHHHLDYEQVNKQTIKQTIKQINKQRNR